MDRDKLGLLLRRLKRTLLTDRRLTREEFYLLLELSEAIIEHGRMIRVHRGSSLPYAIVEILELASRFRETQETIKDALELLKEMDRAEPSHLRGCWRLSLADTLRSEGEHDFDKDVGAA
jgi:hypothetical protein